MKLKDFLTEKGYSLEGKSAEELAGIYNEYNEAIRKALEEKVEAKASKDDINALKSELINSQNEQTTKLNEVLKAHGIAIKQVLEGSKAKAQKSLKDLVAEQKESLEKLQAGDQSARLTLKVAGTMLAGANITGGNVPQAQRLPMFNDLPLTPRNAILAYVTNRSASSNLIEWVDKRNRDGAAGMVAEGAAKPQADFDFVVESAKVKKVAAFIKVSTEMLNDIPFMQSAINDELREIVSYKLADQVLAGDNTGENLKGVLTAATAWAAGAFATAITTPNTYDVLKTAIVQAQEAGYNPNVIMLNPSDKAKMEMTKSTQAEYVNGQFLFMGIPVVANSALTADNFLVYDVRAVELFMWENFNITVGYENDDFTKNLVTIIGELRAANVISTNKSAGIIKGVISTAKTAITKA